MPGDGVWLATEDGDKRDKDNWGAVNSKESWQMIKTVIVSLGWKATKGPKLRRLTLTKPTGSRKLRVKMVSKERQMHLSRGGKAKPVLWYPKHRRSSHRKFLSGGNTWKTKEIWVFEIKPKSCMVAMATYMSADWWNWTFLNGKFVERKVTKQ